MEKKVHPILKTYFRERAKSGGSALYEKYGSEHMKAMSLKAVEKRKQNRDKGTYPHSPLQPA